MRLLHCPRIRGALVVACWVVIVDIGLVTDVRAMQQVSFTYPGAAKQQLSDVNVRVALSSRIAVLGANGAGKVRSTCDGACQDKLIKLK